MDLNATGCLQRAVDYIEANLCQEVSIEEAAASAYMSPFYFQRMFSLLLDVTVGDYIRNRRLALAGDALRTAGERVIDIALRYGYETPEGFSRAFARFHGMSPSAARAGKGALRAYPKLSVPTLSKGDNAMKNLKDRGYAVMENGPVYYTRNMDGTVKWFEDTLGWFGGIDARDADGAGTYGCLLPFPGELVHMKLATFNGIHMFRGAPSDRLVAFIPVDSIEGLRNKVASSGWDKIGGIADEPWGARSCDVTTIDGSIMRFFEIV